MECYEKVRALQIGDTYFETKGLIPREMGWQQGSFGEFVAVEGGEQHDP